MGRPSGGIHAYLGRRIERRVVLTFFEHPHFHCDVTKSLSDLQSQLDGSNAHSLIGSAVQ